MPRRRYSQQIESGRVLDRLQAVIDSPLVEVGNHLHSVFSELQSANQPGKATFDFESIARDFNLLLDILPRAYGPRFFFDASVILGCFDYFSISRVKFNPMIVPLYRNNWGHQSLPLPSTTTAEIKIVDFVLFPGQDDLTEIDLLSYPFLVHELGHNIFFKYDEPFRSRFHHSLETITNKMALSSIADQGAARLQSQQNVEMVRKYWQPTANHKNWAYEIAIDTLALWVTGPGYLAAFIDETEKPQADPFSIQDHPPFDLRAKVLVRLAQELGWDDYLNELKQLIASWQTSRPRRRTSELNRYASLANQEIVETCIACALEQCRSLQLPKCTEQVLSRIQRTLENDGVPDFGLELIIASWLVHNQRGDDGYHLWQSRVVQALRQYIRQ